MRGDDLRDDEEPEAEPAGALGPSFAGALERAEDALVIPVWMFLAFVHGVFVLAGAAMTIVHLVTLKPAQPAPAIVR